MSLSTLKACGIDKLLAGGTPTLPVFYQRNGAPSEIVDLVALSNKRFGTDMETIVCGLTGCKKVPDTVGETGWDCEHEETKNFPEIKSSRYWQGVKDWRWQHILADHEWSHVILAAVDFQEIKLFLLTKDTFMALMEKGIVTQQGGAGGQGCWMEYRKAAQFLHPITGDTLEELHQNTTKLFNKYPSSREAKTKEEIDEALQKGRLVIEAGKQRKTEERLAKKAVKEAEKKRKAEERLAKKAVKEAEKQRKAEERASKIRAKIKANKIKDAEKMKKAAIKATKRAIKLIKKKQKNKK